MISIYRRAAAEIKYKPYLGIHNITLDVCGYLGGKTPSMLADMLYKDIRKYSNIFHSCPFSVRLSGAFQEHHSFIDPITLRATCMSGRCRSTHPISRKSSRTATTWSNYPFMLWSWKPKSPAWFVLASSSEALSPSEVPLKSIVLYLHKLNVLECQIPNQQHHHDDHLRLLKFRPSVQVGDGGFSLWWNVE